MSETDEYVIAYWIPAFAGMTGGAKEEAGCLRQPACRFFGPVGDDDRSTGAVDGGECL